MVGQGMSHGLISLVYWGLTPQQQPVSYQGGEMMMMKSVFWWRKPEYPVSHGRTANVPWQVIRTFNVPGVPNSQGMNELL